MIDREIFDKAMKKIGYGTMTIQLELDKANVFYGVIFTHWFAKAFWGEEVIDDFGHLIINNDDEESEMFPFTNQEKSAYYREQDVAIMQKSWQYHLQQMVLEEEPLKYLSKFLD